jgi:hypothetical protein
MAPANCVDQGECGVAERDGRCKDGGEMVLRDVIAVMVKEMGE